LVKLFECLWRLEANPVIDMRLYVGLGPALERLDRDAALADELTEELAGV